jgi:tetratricopeptide (TPR) repeat protein
MTDPQSNHPADHLDEPSGATTTRSGRSLVIRAGVLIVVILAGAFLSWDWLNETTPEQAWRDGCAALDAGDLEALNSALDRLQNEAGWESETQVLRGGLFLKTGRADLAMREFDRIRPQGRIREQALLLTGECLYELGQLDLAKNLFAELSTEQPDHAAARRWLAAIYYDLGAMDYAIVELRKLNELTPDDYRPYHLAGTMFLDFERYPEAVGEFRMARDRQPSLAVADDILRGLVTALVRTRDFEAALSEISNGPATADMLALKAECLWSLGDRPAAAQALKAAEQRAPNNRTLLLAQAKFRLVSGDALAAVEPLQRAVKLAPHDHQALYQLANALRQAGQYEQYEQVLAEYQSIKARRDRLTELHIVAIHAPNDAAVREKIAALCDELQLTDLAAMWRRAAQISRRMADAQTRAKPARPDDTPDD